MFGHLQKMLAGMVLLELMASAGCASNAGNGALIGGATGAGAGALLGSAGHNAGSGAILGSAVGAITGAIIGNQIDRDQADRARYDRGYDGPYDGPVYAPAYDNPPPPRVVVVPGPGPFWVGGHWGYRYDHWVWIPGHWA